MHVTHALFNVLRYTCISVSMHNTKYTHTLWHTAVITVTPRQNYTLPYNSDDVITYHCEVDSIATESKPFWTIEFQSGNQIQLQDNQSILFAEKYGIIVKDFPPYQSSVNVTHDARLFFRDQYHTSRLVIGCQTFSFDLEIPKYTIVTYGMCITFKFYPSLSISITFYSVYLPMVCLHRSSWSSIKSGIFSILRNPSQIELV